MKTETKILLAILTFSAILLTMAVTLLSKVQNKTQDASQETRVYQIDYSTGQKIGTDSAKIKLVEFSDLQCPACKAFEPFVKQLLQDYKDNIYFVYKHFPLPQHQNAYAAANFAEYGATEGKFWQVHDRLFETQTQWENLKNPIEFFLSLGKELGLDQNKLKEALDKSSFNQIINQQSQEGRNLNVMATPTIFLNGKKMNLQNFADMKNAIEKELTK